MNGLHNCEFIAGDVLKVIDSIEEKPDYIVLDPPRDGIHPKALEKNHSLQCASDGLYFLQTDQSGKRSGRFLQARGYEVKRPLSICSFDVSCGDGSSFVPTKTR